MKFKDEHQRDQSLLSDRVNILKKQYSLDDENQALISLFLSHKFMAEEDEINECYTDGGNDLGIDAIYINRDGEDPIIHIIQSKYHSSERKSRNPFKYSELDKISRFFDVLKDVNIDLAKVANFKLREKIFEIRNLWNSDMPEYRIWLVSNGAPPIPHEINPVKARIENNETKVCNFHLIELVDLCIERKRLHETRTFYAREEGIVRFTKFDVTGAFGLISAFQLYELLKDRVDPMKIEPSLFDINVRGFLGLDGTINKNIFKSASSKKNKFFWALNNGITMIAPSGKMHCQSDRPKIRVKNLNIVNGAQTCSAIFNAMKPHHPDFKPFRELSVQFRLFITDEPELIEKISISTNSQNRINARDLKANDKLQKSIEIQLKKVGIAYIRKRGTLFTDDELIPLDALKAGQIILSYQLLQPDRAKRESDSIFARDYHKIYNAFEPNKMFRGLTLYNRVLEVRATIEDEMRIKGRQRVENDFVTYGVFHILAVCSILEQSKAKTTDDKLIDQAIAIIGKVLKRKNYPAYYSFFRDPRATEEIVSEPTQRDLFY